MFFIIIRGGNFEGQLGREPRTDVNAMPEKIESVADEFIIEVVCGRYHTCVVTSSGSTYTWGKQIVREQERIVMLPSLMRNRISKKVICLSAAFHTVFVVDGGEVYSWGEGNDGQLGHGDQVYQHSPRRVDALVGVKVKGVSCGLAHTAVCTTDGVVYTFGDSCCGQLGHGDTKMKTSPRIVYALSCKNVSQVQCCDLSTFALTASGYVFTWGSDLYGILGHGNLSKADFLTVPSLVDGLCDYKVVQIDGGPYHCAVLANLSSCPIRQSQRDSFNKKEHSNVVFMVENESYYANIDTLTENNSYFKAMFRCRMRENIERIVEVQDCTKDLFLQMLQFFYFDNFRIENVEDVIGLWCVADMYQIEGLKFSCMSRIERCSSGECVFKVLEEAEDLDCPCEGLKSICKASLNKL